MVRVGRRRARRLKNASLILLVCVGILSLTAPVWSNSHGIEDVNQTGCTCHSPKPGAGVYGVIDGIPQVYKPAKSYAITIRIEGGGPYSSVGHHGGFDLKTTAGSLGAPLGSGDVQITNTAGSVHDDSTMTERPWKVSGEATHTHEGANKHEWRVMWNAPWPGDGDAVFYLAVQAVDGDHKNTPGDRWATGVFRSSEGAFDPAEIAWIPLSIIGAITLVVALVLLRKKVKQRRSGNAQARKRTRELREKKRTEREELERRQEKRREREVSKRSEARDGFSRCVRCGAEVKAKNLQRHVRKAHGGAE